MTVEEFFIEYKIVCSMFNCNKCPLNEKFNTIDNNKLIFGVDTIERSYYNAIPTRLKTLADFCSNFCKGLHKLNFIDNPDFI